MNLVGIKLLLKVKLAIIKLLSSASIIRKIKLEDIKDKIKDIFDETETEEDAYEDPGEGPSSAQKVSIHLGY